MRVVGNIQMKVNKIIQETPFVKQFELVPVDGKPLPAFTGGSHLTTYMPSGDKIFEREYSLISNPRDRNKYTISIRRDEASRGGSAFWHDQVKIDSKLEVSFPKNNFPLSFRAKHHAFYAAGIGITPFLAMMEDMAAEGQTFELHYAARTPELCAFYDLLKAKYNDQCTFYFSQAEDKRRMMPETMMDHRIGTHVYFCGPIEMVQEYRKAASSYGYPEHAIHFELFAAKNDGARDPFIVDLTDSDRSIRVHEGETLLDALLREGIDAPYSCKVGGCGSCEVDVAEGEVDHRDFFLSKENRQTRKSILTCCSRAKDDRLVLKL
ncbi:ferredoxin-NADP reductase [Peribacillus frigoritolerans]|uniref:PDR/VanB family oxidoreductase n=1 Tax=Peribacillus frigoritolerans TaxID=450367 RepID=UPI001EDF6BF5|nr:PDR/VanB family oxidoreductase [Peribacillus frigoritolerans]MCP1494466.1 ferredoxin-NADP reductase [Peribacillus frigoritolerans]